MYQLIIGQRFCWQQRFFFFTSLFFTPAPSFFAYGFKYNPFPLLFGVLPAPSFLTNGFKYKPFPLLLGVFFFLLLPPPIAVFAFIAVVIAKAAALSPKEESTAFNLCQAVSANLLSARVLLAESLYLAYSLSWILQASSRGLIPLSPLVNL